MQHDALLVVRLVSEPASDSLDLLDHPVVTFGPGVGDAELQERLNLWPPLQNRGGQAGRLGHVRGDAGGLEPGPAVRRLVPALTGRSVGLQELAEQFLDGPRRADLPGWIVAAQRGGEPGQGFGAELFTGAQQQPSEAARAGLINAEDPGQCWRSQGDCGSQRHAMHGGPAGAGLGGDVAHRAVLHPGDQVTSFKTEKPREPGLTVAPRSSSHSFRRQRKLDFP